MRPSRTGRINHASLVSQNLLCVHLGFASDEKDRSESTRLLFFRIPKLFPTQKEASREENIMNEHELYRMEILGRSSPMARPGLALTAPMWEAVNEAQGWAEPMLFHLITPLEHTPSLPFRSACVLLSVSKSGPSSTKDSNVPLPSSSSGFFGILNIAEEYLRRYSSTITSSAPTFSSPPSLSADLINVLHAQFAHLSQVRDSQHGFDVSPFGDMVYLSLETAPRVDVTSDTVDEADSDSVVHWLGAETLGITDLSPLATDNLPPNHTKVDVDVTTSVDGILSDAQADSLKARTGKIVDLGGARDCHFTYIDWWNGAIVQQVETLYGDFYLFTRKITVAT
ncbi:hypothetical protein DL93DRAFT_2226297 [Clavulina sp. PMI_390]|nr:hypothetical protein DL93DRAFT_2226297 [Clavulina sp. PMI_390]